MASSYQPTQSKPIKFIKEIPLLERKELCAFLDPKGLKNWKTLAGYIGLSIEQVEILASCEYRRDTSPTNELLTFWGSHNRTITELFLMFYHMEHIKCMSIIKPYVDQKFHIKIKELEKKEFNQTQLMLLANQEEDRNQEFPIRSASVGELPIPEPPEDFHHVNPLYDAQPALFSGTKVRPLPPTTPSHPTVISHHSINIHPLNSPSISPYHLESPNYQQLNIVSPPPSSATANSQTTSCNNLPVSAGPAKREPQENEHTTKCVANAMQNTNIKSYDEIMQATENFDEKNLLGVGGFGRVYKAIINRTVFAVKRVQVMNTSSEKSAIKFFFNEIRRLASFRHVNIVQLCMYSINGPRLCLVYEYMHNGSLEDHLFPLKIKKILTWKNRIDILSGAARGIQFLHTSQEKPLVHGDIKSANILLSKHMEPKIGDFGLARDGPGPNSGKSYTFIKTTTKLHGSRAYLPLDYLQTLRLSTKLDTYSFGVVMFEVLCGEKAYDEKREPTNSLVEYVGVILESRIESEILANLKDNKCVDWPKPNIHSSFISLANNCINPSRKKRPEMKEVLESLENIQINRVPANRRAEGIEYNM